MKHSPFASIASVASLCVAGVALTLLSGCGGGGSPVDPAVTATTAMDVGGAAANLNPAFAGTWTGLSVLRKAGNNGVTYISSPDTQQFVTVKDQTATMESVCFDGSGPITAAGAGNSAAWTGSLACPSVSFVGSPYTNVKITLTSAAAILSDDGKTLTAKATGTATGFTAVAEDIVFEFTGTKK